MGEERGYRWPLAREYRSGGLSELSGREQARQIAEGELSSRELVEQYLERIEAMDGDLSAFVEVYGEKAREEADRADEVRRRGGKLGPFHGVPTAVKDHHMVKGTRTTLGSRAFTWLWSPVDDGIVKKLRGAGFVILGKTAMSELGLLPVVEPPHRDGTRNPWDREKTAGGSSGGAGAALAAGMLPVAPGSDGAGSVRIPSALNGLVGLKPTRGLVVDGSDRIDPFRLTAIGPMGRTIDDAAALLDVLAGAEGVYEERSREQARPLRIGVVEEPPFGEMDDGVREAVARAAERLRAAGHKVERRAPPQASLEEFTPLYQRFIARIPVVRPSKLEEVTRWFRAKGKGVSAEDAWRRYRYFEALGHDAMAGVDVMVTATVAVRAPRVREYAELPPGEYFRRTAALGKLTALANITGQPALSVPFGKSGGMPVGVQLLGRHGDDALLFRLARVFEEEGS